MRSQLDHSTGGTVPCPDGSIRFDDAVFGGSPDPRAKSKSKVFYRLDAGVCGRIFDISAVELTDGGTGYASIKLDYPDGTSSYLWSDSKDFAVTTEEYMNTSVKNVVIPDGTEVTVEFGVVIFTPSEGYYNADNLQHDGLGY